MAVDIPSSNPIACICEGGAETAIMDILLDHDLLIFSREQLINDGKVLPRTSVRRFEERYLRVAYDRKLFIIRILDSRSEQFNLRPEYLCQVEKIIKVITSPEIEILIIVSENRWDDYRDEYNKRHIMPKDYCSEVLRIGDVDSPEFIGEYFSDPDFLIDSIIEYHRVHRQENGEASLYDLLKDEYRYR